MIYVEFSINFFFSFLFNALMLTILNFRNFDTIILRVNNYRMFSHLTN